MADELDSATAILSVGAALDIYRGVDSIIPMSSLLSRITIDAEICHGKPVIRGLRYTVESMLEW